VKAGNRRGIRNEKRIEEVHNQTLADKSAGRETKKERQVKCKEKKGKGGGRRKDLTTRSAVSKTQ